MKKKLSRWTALALTLGAVLCFAAGAAAADTLQKITAYLDSGITITLDGEAQVLKDASGTRLYPITYNGSTYLPVRAVAGLAGLEVVWDQATKTVQLGQSKGIDLIDDLKAYHLGGDSRHCQSSGGQTKDISGNTYSHWVSLCSWGKPATASFNLEGKYETLTFQYYAVEDLTLQVLGDNDSVLGEYSVPGGQVAQTVTVPLLHTTQLTFASIKDPDQDRGCAYIFDAHLS